MEKIQRIFPILGKNTPGFSNPWKILPLVLVTLFAARAAQAAGDYGAVADRVEREIRALDVKLQCVPNPVELSATATSVTVRVEARVNDAARDRVNALLVELHAAARARSGGGSLTDVRLVQECRWTVNGAAWGPTMAARVSEIAPVAGRTTVPCSKAGTVSIVADVEWRLEPVRADATAQATPVWVPWTGAKARAVTARAAASLSVVRTAVAPVPSVAAPSFALAIAGPGEAPAGQPVALVANVRALNAAAAALRPQAKIVWSSKGRVLGEGDRLVFSAADAGSHDVVAMLVKQERGSRAVLQVARHSIAVGAKPEPVVDLAKVQAEESARQAAELRAKQAQQAEEKRQADEAQRLLEQQRQAAEAQRLAEEQRKADEARKQAEEQLARQKAEADAAAAAVAQEKARAEAAAEQQAQLQEEQRKADEAKRLAEEQLAKQKAEADAAAAAVAQEKARAEAAVAQQVQLQEEQRKADEAKRLAEEQLAKQKAEADAAAAAAEQEKARAELAAAKQREAAEAAAAAELRAKQAEEEAQQKIAAQQRKLADDGAALEKRGNLEGAIAKYEAALAVAPDDVLAARIADLQKRITEREEQQRRDLEAKKQAEEQLARQKAEAEAAAAAAQEKERAEAKERAVAEAAAAAELKAKQAEEAAQQKIAAQQRKLVDDGAALEQRGNFAGAIAKYEAALGLAKDDALTAHIAEVKQLQAEQEAQQRREDEARKFAKDAKSFERNGDLAGAILAYEEAQKLVPDDKLAARVADLKKQMADQEAEHQRDEAARKLVEEGNALETNGDLAGAVAKYEESLALSPESAIKRRVASLKKQIAAAEEDKRREEERLKRVEEQRREEDARRQADEQRAKEKAEAEAAVAEAAAKEKAAAEAAAAAEQQAKQAELAAQQQRADQASALAEEAKVLESSGDLGGAVAKYEAAVALVPDAVLGKRIKALQKQQAELDEQARRDEEAQKFTGEGQILEQGGDLAGAVAKYEASIKVVPDAVLKKHIADLKKQIAGLEEQARREESARKQAEQDRAKEEARQAAEKQAADKAAAEAQAREEARIAAEKEAAEKAAADAAASAAAAQQAAAAQVQPEPAPVAEVVAPAPAPAAAVVPAIEYELSLTGPALDGKKPKLWDAGKREMVEVTDRLAVFQDIGFSVAVTPDPAAKPLRYEWSIEPAGCSANTLHEREIRIRASEAGTYTLGVTVRDANDVVLGSASAALAISISRADLDHALAAQDADAKVVRAKGLVEKGRLDDAIETAAEAMKEDPASKEAAALFNQWTSERKIVQEQVAASRGWMAKKDYEQALAAWTQAQDLQPHYAPVRELEDELKAMKHTVDRAQNFINEGYAQERGGNFAGAISKYEAAVKLVPDAKLAARVDQLKKKQVEAEAQKLIEEGYAYERTGDIPSAIERYERAQAIFPDDRVAAHLASLKAAAPAK